jgi:hypothetical protein
MMDRRARNVMVPNKGGKMKYLLCPLFLFTSGLAYADPPPMPPAPIPTPAPLVVPKAVTTNKRGTATIEVTTSGKSVVVANPFDDVTDVFRLYSDDPAKYVFRFEGDAAGSYKLLFITSVGDKPVLAPCVVKQDVRAALRIRRRESSRPVGREGSRVGMTLNQAIIQAIVGSRCRRDH